MNRLKYILPLLTLFIFSNTYAQKRKEINNDRVKAYKIAYITNQLSLTEKEAQKFWPIYNAHEELMLKFRAEERSTIKRDIADTSNLESMSETEAKNIVVFVSELRNKTHKENETYFSKLKKILPYKKILKLQIAERGFKKRLFENLRKKRKKEKK